MPAETEGLWADSKETKQPITPLGGNKAHKESERHFLKTSWFYRADWLIQDPQASGATA